MGSQVEKRIQTSTNTQIKELEQLLMQKQLFETPFDELSKKYPVLVLKMNIRRPTIGVINSYLANLLTQYRRVRRHYFEILPLEEVLFFPKIQHAFYAILADDYYKKQQPLLDEPIRPYNYGESPDFFRSKQIPEVRNYFVTELRVRGVDKFPKKIFHYFNPEERIIHSLKESSGCIERYMRAEETNKITTVLTDAIITQAQDEAIIALRKLHEQHN